MLALFPSKMRKHMRRQCARQKEDFGHKRWQPLSVPRGVNKTHTPERHISRASALIFILHSAGLCLTSSIARASNFKHCLRVKNGFCSHSGPRQSLVRCQSGTSQTIRRTSTSSSSTTTRSPLPAWQPCLRTLAQGARSAVLPNKPQLHSEVLLTRGTAHRSLNQCLDLGQPLSAMICLRAVVQGRVAETNTGDISCGGFAGVHRCTQNTNTEV